MKYQDLDTTAITDGEKLGYLPLESWTSVSGGKSSAYMAVHFPTDRYVFSAVLTSDHNCVIKDKSLRRYCQNKLPKFDWDNGGSRELDLTLHNLRKLEQMLGKEIEWTAAPFTFDEVIEGTANRADAITYGSRATKNQACLPNSRMRFCTTTMKVMPVTWHILINGRYPGRQVLMNIGYRADEAHRVNNWKCQRVKLSMHCDIQGRFRGKHRHQDLDYRIVGFPMHDAGVDKIDVARFWLEQGWEFPKVSNCDGCFFHQDIEQLTQHREYPERMQWWIDKERETGHTFAKKSRLTQLEEAEQFERESRRTQQLSLPLEEHFTCLCSD